MNGRGPSRALCAVLLALGCAIIAGCGQGSGGASSDDPGYTITSLDTAPRTTSQQARNGGALVGTAGDDKLRAGDGAQVVRGMGGNDEISGGDGRDRLYGGPGDDVVDAQDRGSGGRAGRDEVSCGPGRDEVLMDAEDGERPEGCEIAGVGSS